jgi:hypothetical protein
LRDYGFGSAKKRKKRNYMMQLRDKTVCEIFEFKTRGFKAEQLKYSRGLQVLIKYQIKDLFWEGNNTSDTKINRNRVWSALDKMIEDIKYQRNKERVRNQKQILRNDMLHRVKEKAWEKFMKKLDKNECFDFYFDIYPHYEQLVCRVSEYRTWVLRRLRSHPIKRYGERLEVIKKIRCNELERKRL